MNSFYRTKQVVLASFSLVLASTILLHVSHAQTSSSSGLRFQRPGDATSSSSNHNFRRPGSNDSQATSVADQGVVILEEVLPEENVLRPKKKKVVAKKKRKQRQPKTQQVTKSKSNGTYRDENVAMASQSKVVYEQDFSDAIQLTSHDCPHCQGDCNCDDSMPMLNPSYEMYDSGYMCDEPVCGCPEPVCGCPEPSCGIIEPSCGCSDGTCGVPGCGSCVGRPGPDYWCFPICFPRFKDLSVWGGVQGFRGPRDFIPAGESNSNFGFHEGFNISGRAPLVGMLFPQLSYQLGYQAVQSRLHGTLNSADDRSQQFVTAGLFRRVHTGLQFGAVWDMMDDDLDTDVDLQQIRTEISLKSPRGREIGFWSATSTNSSISGGVSFETVNQYAFFYRCNFGNSYQARFWGGFTDDDEGLFGAELYAPLSDRWSVRSGFNYLSTDQDDGPLGVQEESWNIGMSLVWHLGRNARRGCHSPFRPLFSVADNGWMFVDRQ